MLRRLPSHPSAAWLTSCALSCASRSASRRFLLPVHLQKPTEPTNLRTADLLLKWSSDHNRQLFLQPLIRQKNDTPTAGEGEPRHQTLPAAELLSRMSLNPYEVAQIICVLEGKLPSTSVSKHPMTFKISRDANGSVSIGGLVHAKTVEGALSEATKRIYAVILEPEDKVLLKHHLDSVLVEMFGIENYHFRQKFFPLRSSAQRSVPAYNSSPPAQREKRGVFASELEDSYASHHEGHAAPEEDLSAPTCAEVEVLVDEAKSVISPQSTVQSKPQETSEGNSAVDAGKSDKKKEKGKKKASSKKKSGQDIFDL